MNDRDIIMSAYLSSSSDTSRKVKVSRDIFAEPLDALAESPGAPDAIAEAVKRNVRAKKRRQKPLSQWTNADFLRHLDSLLSVYDMAYERQSAQRDRAVVGRIYDRLADHFLATMDNQTLKSYFEWWVSMYAERLHDSMLYVRALHGDKCLDRYLSRFAEGEKVTKTEVASQGAPEDLDDDTLYDAGGLTLLIMNRGIVVGHRMLMSRQEAQPLIKIAAVLRSFDKGVLDQVMRITMQQSYSQADKVDFVTLAQPYLSFHNLKEYTKFQYEKFFGPSR